MLPSLSKKGLDFISSWVLFSNTPYKIEEDFSDRLYIGFRFYGQPLPSFPFITVTSDLSWTTEYSKIIFREELIPLTFYILNKFKNFQFTQNEVDALISFLQFFNTCKPLELFTSTDLFKALVDKKPPSVIASLIEDFYKDPSWNTDILQKHGVFFDLSTRGALESSLYLNSLYTPCPALNVNEKVVDNIKVFY